jgi:aspartyl-tRNA(Asn)/glutamyl-tRNA(Gln) amidotransferase subunit A
LKTYNSLSHIQEELRAGSITCRELVGHYLSKIEQKAHLNAFLEVYAAEAESRAAEVDSRIKAGTQGRLAGMVLAIKDNICYKGHSSTASSKILKGFVNLYSATVIERLLKEDVIIIGRTNCDEFAMGASNENSAYGNVLNDADNSCVPGGSSGGSAVAVQADLCLAALGSDTGGSIRQPAAFCGVYGLKPTYARISRYGLIAYASSFDQIGPITRSLEDAALLLEIMSGQDGHDATVSSREVPAYSQQLNNIQKTYRIAFLKDCLYNEGVDSEIRERIEEKIEKLKAAGHTVEGVDFKYLDYLVPAYYVLTTAEASSNLSRFSGLLYGYRSPNATDLDSTFRKSRSEGFGEEVKRRIMLGTFVLSAGYYDAYYSRAQKVRRIIQDKTAEILKEYDFILLPTTPTTAFKIGEKASNPIAMYLADIFTVQAPLAGLPAISLPAGNHSNGLPIGIQVIADKFEEGGMLAFSKYLQSLN